MEVKVDHRGDTSPLADLLHREGAVARLVSCRPYGGPPHRAIRWIDVRAPRERLESFLRGMQRHTVGRHLGVSPLGPDRILLRILEDVPPSCTVIGRSGGFCLNCAQLAQPDDGPWRVALPRGRHARAFVRALPKGAGKPSISPLSTSRTGTGLTHRQDRALRAAFDLGFFDYPRKSSLAEVARALGVGRSATLEILRRATAKLARERYGFAAGLQLAL